MPVPCRYSQTGSRRRARAVILVAGWALAATVFSVAEAQSAPSGAITEDFRVQHLDRGLSYMEQGDYARAVLEFEQVFQLDYVSPDVRERAEAYAEAARRARRGERVAYSGFAQAGLGYYRENNTDSTSAAGDDPARDPFVLARLNGGLNYLTGNAWALDGNLDYRFRDYDAAGRRNDSDLRWAGTGRRSLAEGSFSVGSRGRVSYRGDGDYRNDFGLFVNREYLLDSDNSFSIEVDLRRREYPSSQSERDRTNGEAILTWSRTVQEGRGSVSVNARAGYEWRRSRSPDGNATVYGLAVEWSGELTDSISAFLFGWYEHNGFHSDRVVFDEQDTPGGEQNRADDLFEFGGGVVVPLAPGWTLRPEVLYVRDDSNYLWGNYSSTEFWLAVRRAL